MLKGCPENESGDSLFLLMRISGVESQSNGYLRLLCFCAVKRQNLPVKDDEEIKNLT
jgi:hypothetical protein